MTKRRSFKKFMLIALTLCMMIPAAALAGINVQTSKTGGTYKATAISTGSNVIRTSIQIRYNSTIHAENSINRAGSVSTSTLATSNVARANAELSDGGEETVFGYGF